MSDERCELTDLLPSDCGCPKHRNSEGIERGRYQIRNTVPALRDGTCVLNEDHLIVVEDEIGLVVEVGTSLDTHGSRVGIAHGWACPRCTREIQRSKS